MAEYHHPHVTDEGWVCGGEPCSHDDPDGEVRPHDYGEDGLIPCPHPPGCRRLLGPDADFCAHCGEVLDLCPQHAAEATDAEEPPRLHIEAVRFPEAAVRTARFIVDLHALAVALEREADDLQKASGDDTLPAGPGIRDHAFGQAIGLRSAAQRLSALLSALLEGD